MILALRSDSYTGVSEDGLQNTRPDAKVLARKGYYAPFKLGARSHLHR